MASNWQQTYEQLKKRKKEIDKASNTSEIKQINNKYSNPTTMEYRSTRDGMPTITNLPNRNFSSGLSLLQSNTYEPSKLSSLILGTNNYNNTSLSKTEIAPTVTTPTVSSSLREGYGTQNEEGYTYTGKNYGDYWYQDYNKSKDNKIYEKDGKYYVYNGKSYQDVDTLTFMTTKKADKKQKEEAIKSGYTEKEYDASLKISDRIKLDTANLDEDEYKKYESDLQRQQEAKNKEYEKKNEVRYGGAGLKGTLGELKTLASNIGYTADKEIIAPIKNFSDNYESGKMNNQLALEYYKKMQGEENNADEMAEKVETYNKFNQDLIEDPGAAGTAIQQLNTQVESIKNQGIAATVLSGLGALGGAVLTRTPQGAMTGAKVGGAVGYTFGSTPYMYKLEAGNQFKTLTDMGVPDDIAKKYSKVTGGVNAAIESGENILDIFTLGTAGKTTSAISKEAVNEMIDEYGESQVKTWFKNKVGEETADAIVKGVKVAGVSYLQNIGSEAVEEAAQETTSIVTERMATNEAGIEREATTKDDVKRILESGLTAMISTAFTAPLTSIGGSIVTSAVNKVETKINNKKASNKQVTTEEVNEEIQKEIEANETDLTAEEIQQIQSETFTKLQNEGITISGLQQNQYTNIENNNNNIENITNSEYNNVGDVNGEGISYSLGGNDRTGERGISTFQASSSKAETETVLGNGESRKFDQREYNQFEERAKATRKVDLTEADIKTVNETRERLGKEVVFFTEKNASFNGGASTTDPNVIYVSDEFSDNGKKHAIYHETMESTIVHDKQFANEYLKPAIKDIINDPNFETMKENFKSGEADLENVSDYLIAKDILADYFAEKNTGVKTPYEVSLTKETLETLDYISELTSKKINEKKGTTLNEGSQSSDISNSIDNNISQNENIVNDSISKNAKSDTKYSLSDTDLKQKQLDIILKENPMTDDYHTGIRTIEDIKTFDETINDDESFVWGDFSQEDAKKALEKGEITVYSSYPIEQGVFVSTSKNQAQDYAGSGKVYSKTVPLNEVAWINGDEGQYAKVDNTQYSLGEDTTPKNHNLTYGEDIALQISPLQEEIKTLAETVNELKEQIAPVKQITESYKATTEADLPMVEQQYNDNFKSIPDEELDNMIAPVKEDTTPDVEFEHNNEGTQPMAAVPNPFENRDIADVGKRSVKAYQYEHPEVRPYFQTEAIAMLGDLQNSVKGKRMVTGDISQVGGGYFEYTGQTRQTTDDIAYLLDNFNYTYKDIEKGLNAIIEDHGEENIAVAKRIEFMLNDRLLNGYTSLDGTYIPANEEYRHLQEIEGINDYYNNLTFDDTDAPIEIKEEQYAPTTGKLTNITPASEIPTRIDSTGQASLDLGVKKLKPVDNTVLNREVEPINLETSKQLTLDGKEENLVTKTKKELRKALLGTDAQKEFITSALDNAKNRSMALMNNTDTIRNTELVFGRDAGKMINEIIFQKEIDNEASSIAWQNKERQEIKNLGIKARSKESAAVQKYGEKQYVDKYGKVVHYGDNELANEFSDIETQNKIKNAAQVIRNKYDKYIDDANNVLTKLGFEPIKKRKDYMRHFQELNDVFSKYGIPFNAQNMAEHTLPTDINGLTEYWSPQKNYFANMQARKGVQTTYDAITGVDGYISGISNLIFHTEDIQRGRAFEELIRETYGEDKGWDNLENLPEELQQARSEKIQDNHLSNYAAWVHEWTNNVAGKKSKIDRSVESVFGRKAFAMLDATRKQVGANMIGLNLSSSLTNLIAPVQAMAKTNKLAVVKGTADTIKNMFIKDNFIENNKFLTSRMGTDMLSKNAWQKMQDAGFIFMKGMDWFSSNQIVRSKYYELRAKGMSEAEAHSEAGQFAARIMGDRTKGANAQLYNSKLLGLVTQFQLEVNNQLYSTFYDTYHESKENAKSNAIKTAAGMTFTLGQLFALTHLFGQTFEAIAGYNPTFDVVEMLKTAFGWGEDDEDDEKTTSERLKDAADQLVDALPYVNILTGGGRIPVASGIPNLVGVATGGKDQYGNELKLEDEMKKLLYLIPPTGGNQFKKTAQGLAMFDEELPVSGSYTDSGNLRFPVEDTPLNRVQAAIFGQWANKNAQTYFDEERQPLKEKQIKEYADLDLPIADYWEYRDGLKELKTTGEKLDYINNLDVSDEQKIIMIDYVASKGEDDFAPYKGKGEYEATDNYIVAGNREYYKYVDNKGNTKWKKVDEEESEELNKLGLTASEKNTYFSTKEEISSIVNEYKDNKDELSDLDEDGDDYKEAMEQLSNEKKTEIINKIKNTGFTDEQKAYMYKKYYNSDTIDTIITTGIDVDTYLDYSLEEFEADYNYKGNAISGSRKKKVVSYVNSLDLSIPQKAILIKSTNTFKFNDYNADIVEYVSELDMSYDEKIDLLEELDMTVYEDGTVKWK